MSLKDSRNRTYVDGVTQIPAGDMNDIQDEIVDLWKNVNGSRFDLYDDFCGSAISTSNWKTTHAGVTVVDSGTDNKAMGSLQLAATAGNTTPYVYSSDVLIGTRAFRAMWLMRYATLTTGDIDVGLLINAGTNRLQFDTTNGGNWAAWYGAGPTIQTLGVAPSTSYQRLELIYDGTTAYWYIDGVLKYSVAFATISTDTATLFVAATYSANVTAYCDAVKWRIDR